VRKKTVVNYLVQFFKVKKVAAGTGVAGAGAARRYDAGVKTTTATVNKVFRPSSNK
jgi:hypothetical protein